MKLALSLAGIFSFAFLSPALNGITQSAYSDWAAPHPAASVARAGQEKGKFVYADFETVKDNRPVSNNGGLIQLYKYEAVPTLESRFKAVEGSNPPAPELVRTRKEDPNRAITFELELRGTNQYAGVGVQVHGHPEIDGKPGADDVSSYKNMSLELYAQGIESMRVEFISKGHDIKMSSGDPQMSFKAKPGLNTYKIQLKSLRQPSWAEVKVSPKDVLKQLTSVNIVAYCEQCVPIKGVVVIDNIIFEN